MPRPSSAGMIPMERVRISKISFPATRSSNVSHASRVVFIAVRVSLIQPHGKVVLQPADAVEVGVETSTGRRLDQVEDVLAVAKPVERGRERADLQAHLAEEQEERGDAAQLGEDRADVLRTRRCLDSEELLGGVDERHLVRKARQPVDAIDERGDLRVGAELGELLVAAVHVPDHRVGRDDPFAIEADDDPERSVGRRVLRTEVEDHVSGVELDVDLRVGEMPVDARVDLDVGERRVRRAHDSTPDSAVASAAAASPSVSPALASSRRRRRASPRRRRGPATASRLATATHSPYAADVPRTRTGR